MAKPIEISIEARQDIVEIIEQITEFTGSIYSGQKFYDELREKIALIGYMPQIGRVQADVPMFRETFYKSYRIVYQELTDKIVIITVIHSRRLYPRP